MGVAWSRFIIGLWGQSIVAGVTAAGKQTDNYSREDTKSSVAGRPNANKGRGRMHRAPFASRKTVITLTLINAQLIAIRQIVNYCKKVLQGESGRS
jgi:hypothetical protein